MPDPSYGPEPSGLRLMRLINTRSLEIARREFRNADKLCLYGTGGYWTAFEHSAYFLSRFFPNLESFVCNHPNYPDSIVGVSVSDRQLNRLKKQTAVHSQDTDYLEFPMNSFEAADYHSWHEGIVTSLRA